MTLVGTGSQSVLGGGDNGPQYAVISGKVVDKRLRKRSLEDIVEWVAQRTARIPGAEMISVAVQSGGGPGSEHPEGSPGPEHGRHPQGGQQPGRGDEQGPRHGGCGHIVQTQQAGAPDCRGQTASRTARYDRLGRWLQPRGPQSTATIRSSSATAAPSIPIRVHYNRSERNKTSDVENLIIGTKDGAPIYLNDVAQVKYDTLPTKIDRKNRQRVVYVTANLAQGAEMGNVDQTIRSGHRARCTHVPGTTVDTGGSTQMMNESFGYMGSALLLAVLLVYMLMGALFESFLTPFVIMFSLPQAMIGALLALLITGKPMSIVGMIGIIMLMGLVTKNAILLIDYTNTLMSRGKSRHDALLEAGPTRLRPILMTTLAMIGGMMPTALALSEGSETRSPMAICVIGGLILSTMLTLIVIPVTFTIVDDVWHWVKRHTSPMSMGEPFATEEVTAELTPAGADTE